MSDYISEELWVEILKRLPVSSLIKFRCVCKSWYSLISSSTFRSIHLAHSIGSEKTYSLVQMRSRNDSDKFLLCCNNVDVPLMSHKELDLSFIQNSPNKPVKIEVIGSCDGLICFIDLVKQTLYLWNPAVMESITVLSGKFSFAVGFGFDYKKNDYKIVRVVYDFRSSFPGRKLLQPSAVEIYELSSGSWRSISVVDLPYFVSNYFGCNTKNIGAYLNSAYHWLVERNVDEMNQHRIATIASFSFCVEMFDELLLPDALAEFAAFSMSLTVCNKSLAVIQYGPQLNNGVPSLFTSCSIWVMKEYGVVESWSKQFIVNLENYGGLRYVLGFQQNGEILFQTRDDEMATYDPKTQEIAPRGIYCSLIDVHPYSESLLLLKAAAENPNAGRH